jgi:hypothetical protein
LETIRNFATGESATLPTVERIDYSSFPYDKFNLNRATSKTFGLLLVSCSPKSLLDGSKIDTWQALSVINRYEYHHIFPKAFLERSGVTAEKAEVQANLCLLSRGNNRDIWYSRPAVYFKIVEENLGSKLHDVLASNLISSDAYAACLREDYDVFIEERAKTIRQKIRELVNDPETNDVVQSAPKRRPRVFPPRPQESPFEQGELFAGEYEEDEEEEE